MSDLDLLLSAIPPEMLAADFADESSMRVGDDGSISCSFGGRERLKIKAGGFVSENFHASAFKAGSVVDVMAAMVATGGKEGRDMFADAVSILASRYKHLFSQMVLEQDALLEMASQARCRRRLFNLLVCLSATAQDLPGNAALWCRKLFGQAGVPAGRATVCVSGQVDILRALVQELGADLPDCKRAPACVIPYFANTHEIAAISIFPLRQGGDWHRIFLTDHSLSFAGLLDAQGEPMALAGDIAEMVESPSSILPAHNPAGTRLGHCPTSVLLRRGTEKNLGTVIMASRLAAAGTDIVLESPAGDVGWLYLLTDALAASLRRSQSVTPEASLLAFAAVRHPLGKDTLVEALSRDEGTRKFLPELERTLGSCTLAKTPTGTIIQMPTGYILESRKGPGRVHITNFTLEPLVCISYEDGSRFYQCTLSVGGQAMDPVTVPGKALESPHRLAECLQQAVVLGGQAGLPFMPAVLEPIAMRYVISHLMHACAYVPQVQGISYLGWNGQRTRYTGPGFVVLENKISHQEVAVFKPGVACWECFSTAPHRMASSCRHLSDGAMHLVYGIAGMIAREFEAAPHTPLPVDNSPGNKKLLLQAFEGIGQHAVLALNKNMRNGNGDIAPIQGYPVLAAGYSWEMAQKCRTSLVLLVPCSDGRLVQKDAQVLGMFLRYLCEYLPEKLAREGGAPFPVNPAPATVPQLKEEGKAVLEWLLAPEEQA